MDKNVDIAQQSPTTLALEAGGKLDVVTFAFVIYPIYVVTPVPSLNDPSRWPLTRSFYLTLCYDIPPHAVVTLFLTAHAVVIAFDSSPVAVNSFTIHTAMSRRHRAETRVLVRYGIRFN